MTEQEAKAKRRDKLLARYRRSVSAKEILEARVHGDFENRRLDFLIVLWLLVILIAGRFFDRRHFDEAVAMFAGGVLLLTAVRLWEEWSLWRDSCVHVDSLKAEIEETFR